MAKTIYDIWVPRLAEVQVDFCDCSDCLSPSLPVLPQAMYCVTRHAHRAARKAVYEIACMFRREFHFDFVQYGFKGQGEDSEHHAYIWVKLDLDVRLPVIGACCFRRRRTKEMTKYWAMQWIWIHPYERRRGHLTGAWPYFKKRFGDFYCEPPLSEAMISFLVTQEKESNGRPQAEHQRRP